MINDFDYDNKIDIKNLVNYPGESDTCLEEPHKEP